MAFTFKPLWKLLIDRNMTKEELRVATGLSSSTIARMGRDKHVSMGVLHKICEYLNCQPGDIFAYIPDKEGKDHEADR